MADNEQVEGPAHEDTAVEDLEEVRVALKPRSDLLGTIKEFRSNKQIGKVELYVYKNWLREAEDDEVWGLFDSLGHSSCLQKLTIASKGSATQSLPVSHLSHCLGEASSLKEFRSLHVKWRGDPDDFDVLAAIVGEHPSLRVLQLHVESMDFLEPTIAAAGAVSTMEEVELQTAVAAADHSALAIALQSLCTSKSLRSLKLIHVTVNFEVLSEMARLLSANETLRELMIQATELDLNGGMAMAQMLTANGGLQSFILKLDKMHGNKLGDEFIQALDMNSNLKYFQIVLDGRMSDMKVVRALQLQFRDKLKPKYKVSSQVGMCMGVTCERLE